VLGRVVAHRLGRNQRSGAQRLSATPSRHGTHDDTRIRGSLAVPIRRRIARSIWARLVGIPNPATTSPSVSLGVQPLQSTHDISATRPPKFSHTEMSPKSVSLPSPDLTSGSCPDSSVGVFRACGVGLLLIPTRRALLGQHQPVPHVTARRRCFAENSLKTLTMTAITLDYR
jgi:hypothetical protein